MKEMKTTRTLLSELKGVLTRQRAVMFAAGVVTTIAAVVTISIILSALANVVVLPVWLKILLLTSSGFATAFCFWRFAVAHLFDGDIDQVTVRLEEKHPDLKGRLIAAVQFARSGVMEGYSTELIEVNERQALAKAGLIDFNEVVTLYPVWARLRLIVVPALLGMLLLFIVPGFFSYSYEVYSNPATEIAPPLAYQVTPVPESTDWVKYRDITIGASVFGQRLPEKASIFHRFAGGSWQETEINLESLPRVSSYLGDSLNCALTLRQLNKSFDYYVVAGRIRTDVQQINVVDRPRVASIKLDVFYPDYTELSPSVIDENNGSFSAVPGSRVNMRVESNLPVENATLVFDDSSRVPMQVSGKIGEASLVVQNSRTYYIELIDHLGEKNPDPIEYYITAVPDEYPSIDVLIPGFNVNLTDDMRLPVKVHIYDDYGFSSLVLKYTVVSQRNASDESVAVLHYPDKIKTEGDVEFNWDLGQFHLFPGDYVIYYFEVADNDVISGPKVTKSRQYIARLPSLDELIADTEAESAQRINETERLFKTGKELSERLKQAMRKLEAENRDNKKADWQQQKELESIAEKNLEMLEKMGEMAEQMDASIEKMQENSLMSREIMEKLKEIQQLFEEVATPEMKEAQKRLMEAMEKMDRQQLEEAMKDFKMTQQDLLERLERTMALLKKMQVEQKMEAMIRKAEEMIKQQEGINKQTDEKDRDDLPSLSKPEDDIKKSLEDLKAEVNELENMLKDAKMENKQEARSFSDAVKETDADQNMSRMSESLEQKDKKESQDQGKQAVSKLYKMLDEMQKQQMAMRGGDTEEIKRAMRRSIEDANYLSSNQEELLKEAGRMDPQSMVMRDMAIAQQDLQSACAGLKNSIAELGRKSPFVAAELTALMDNALANMDGAVNQFDSRRGNGAQFKQRDAMVQLNKVSQRLMESLEKQNECQNKSNCNKNTSMMESLCEKQNNLNRQTQQQCNNPSNSPEGQMQTRSSFERLAQEQGAIRKSLEELEQEFGQSRQILGRLDDIAKEMKKVEEDLESGEVGTETTERQLKIFSRMLEASRSLQRKDFTEARQAKTATSELIHIPQALTDDLSGDQNQIEDRLQQYLGDNYPPQYEERIKAYFRALLQLRYQQRQPQN